MTDRRAADDTTYALDNGLITSTEYGDEYANSNLGSPLPERSLQLLSNSIHRTLIGDEAVQTVGGYPAISAHLYFHGEMLKKEPGRPMAVSLVFSPKDTAAFNSAAPRGLASITAWRVNQSIVLNSTAANALILGHEVAHTTVALLLQLGVKVPQEDLSQDHSVAHSGHGPFFRRVHQQVMETLGVNCHMFELEAEQAGTPVMPMVEFRALVRGKFKIVNGEIAWPADVLAEAHRNIGKDPDIVVWNGQTVDPIKHETRSYLGLAVRVAELCSVSRPEQLASEAAQRPVTVAKRLAGKAWQHLTGAR